MKTWIISLITFLIAALIGHVVVLYAAPGFIMDRAMSAMEERGVEVHEYFLTPRTTPQSQTVVRPSPDLAYSICRFELDKTPLSVTAAPWQPYASVSLFDAQTRNFGSVRAESGAAFRLLPPGQNAQTDTDIVSPTRKGLMLIRRLAPTSDDYADVKNIAAGDRCAREP